MKVTVRGRVAPTKRKWEHLFDSTALKYYDLVMANTVSEGFDEYAWSFSASQPVPSPFFNKPPVYVTRYFKRTVEDPVFHEVSEEEYLS